MSAFSAIRDQVPYLLHLATPAPPRPQRAPIRKGRARRPQVLFWRGGDYLEHVGFSPSAQENEQHMRIPSAIREPWGL